MSDAFFVITDYNHLPQDLSQSWVAKYAKDYLIYDRADRWEESDKIKKQINVGENIYDMFHFIVDNYDNLPETMVFVKADVVPRHCGEEKFSKIIHNKEYTPIENYSRTVNGYHHGAYAYVDAEDGYMEDAREIGCVLRVHPGKYFSSYQEFFYEIYDDPIFENFIRFAPGGCHLITKKDILKYNKHFYEMLKEWTGWEIRPGEAFILERGIYTIFTNNFTIKDKYKNNVNN